MVPDLFQGNFALQFLVAGHEHHAQRTAAQQTQRTETAAGVGPDSSRLAAGWVNSGRRLRGRTASVRYAEVAMHDELKACQRAITLRRAGRPVQAICAAIGYSAWFHQ